MTPEQEAAWNELNRERVRVWRLNNLERSRHNGKISTKRARERDPESFKKKRAEDRRRFDKKNPEKLAARNKKWAINNPERRAELRRKSYYKDVELSRFKDRQRHHARKEADNFFVAMATVDAITQFPKTNEPKP